MPKSLYERRSRRKERKTRRKTSRLTASGNVLTFHCESTANLMAALGTGGVARFEMRAYSGGKLYVKGFEHPVVVDLSAAEVKGQDGVIPITLDHEETQRVGHSDSIMITSTGIDIQVSASAETPWRDEVVASARNGFKWQASIEGRVLGRQNVKAGERVTVNGRTFEGPVIVARPFVLRATSFVSSGGDEDNVVRLAASNDRGDRRMDKHFKKWLESKGFDVELVAANETQRDFLQAMWQQEDPNETPTESGDKETADGGGEGTEGESTNAGRTIKASSDHVTAMRERAAAEVERQAAIDKLCAGGLNDLKAKAIREGWTSEKTELEVLRASREQSTPAIHMTDASRVKSGDVLEASLLRSIGEKPEKMGYTEKTLEASDKLRNYGLHAFLHDVIRASGSYYTPGVYDSEFIKAAFRADNTLKANEGFSTISLTGVLSNVANKMLLSAYNAVNGVRRDICKTRSVADFKQVSSYRVTGNGLLLKLGPDGEIKHAEMSEDTYTNQVDTYARMMALTRQMIINDDLGAFAQIPASFGRLSALTEEKAVFTELCDMINDANFFTSGNGNRQGGATTALGIDSLTTAEKLMDELLDSEGNPILVTGSILLVPPALKVYAGQLMREMTVIATGMPTSAAAQKPASNPHAGKYVPKSSPYFGTKHSITGSSDTHWIILADPNDIAILEFAELRGQSGPIIESAETDFNTLGMQWRAYRDFGVARQDPNGGVLSTGVSE